VMDVVGRDVACNVPTEKVMDLACNVPKS